MKRIRKPPSHTWSTFLANHHEAIVAVDFFTVPTMILKILFVFVVIAHARRRVVHFNVTEHPSAQWTAQQLTEAFPFETAPTYLLRDGEAIYGAAVQRRISNLNMKELVTTPASPWENPHAERLIGSIRRECLDHTIVIAVAATVEIRSRIVNNDVFKKIRAELERSSIPLCAREPDLTVNIAQQSDAAG